MTAAIDKSPNPNHHILATRALVRAHLGKWDAALVDAGNVVFFLLTCVLALTLVYIQAIKIQPCVIGYITKSIAHIGNGERDKGYQACDIVVGLFDSPHSAFLLLIKVRIF